MTKYVYYAATTLTGHLADDANSLDWLFAVGSTDAAEGDAPPEGPESAVYQEFFDTIGVMVEGSTTYEWVLCYEKLLERPERWQQLYGDRPTFVFTSRELAVPQGADVRLVSGDVASSLPKIVEAAGDRDVWIVGGGDLAGQFHDTGALDEVQLSVAPVTLASGAPVLPRRIESDVLTLRSVEQRGQFAHLTLDVARG